MKDSPVDGNAFEVLGVKNLEEVAPVPISDLSMRKVYSWHTWLVNSFNCSNLELEADEYLSARPAWST